MSLGHGARISRNELKFHLDEANAKSYPVSGDWKDVVTRTGTAVGGSSTFGTPSWANGLSGFSASLFISILGADTAYAYQPISKWSGTTDASFVLYHFQQFSDNLRTNRLGWYTTTSSNGWIGTGTQYTTTPGNVYHVGLQYGSTSGGQMWINGQKIGSRSANRGTLGTNTSSLTVDGGINGRTGIHKVKYVSLYDRDITDDEMKQSFQALRGRYGL